jgi:shikimate dehydrogenase
MLEPISGHTRTLCLIADPASGSSSPALHNASFAELGADARYLAYTVAPEDLATAVAGMKALGIDGYSVGVPHKAAIIPLLDEISLEAQVMNSVNCVTCKDGVLSGCNTDGHGFVQALKDAGIAFPGAKLVIIDDGAEGPSWIVQAAIDGAAEIVILCARERRETEEAWLASFKDRFETIFRLVALEDAKANAELIGSMDAICNGSRIGVGDTLGTSPLPDALIQPTQVVIDANYNPRVTTLMAEAQEKGCTVIGGLEPLINQAALAERLWLGVELPKEAVKRKLFVE